jgi:hypothetical protein
MGLLDFEKYAPERRTSGDPHGTKLRDAVRTAQRSECPLCTVLDEQERARLHWLAYEGLTDVGLRKRLRVSKGFCRRHFRMLFDAASGQIYNLAGVADVMSDLVRDDIEALTSAAPGGKRGRRAQKVVAALRARTRCQLCEAANEATERKLRTLLEALADDAFRAEYAASPGLLCRPHLVMALTRDADDVVVDVLVGKHLATLEAERDGLAEYLRKRDHRFAAEPKGDEQEAPLRSVTNFAGTWPG